MARVYERAAYEAALIAGNMPEMDEGAEEVLAAVRELATGMEQALAGGQGDDDTPVLDLFARQGRQELRAWAAHRDPALGEWVALLHPREPATPTYLPERPVLLLCTHHETRAARA